MASDEEIFKIIAKVEGEQEVKRLGDALAAEEAQLRQLISTLGKHDAATKASATAVGQLQQQLRQAQASTMNVGQAALEGSRALEDLQYGVGGVLNNIPGLVMALGGSAGLTATISILAVAGAQLYKHWGELAELFGAGHTKTEAEEMDELGKATKRTADEEEHYQKLKERDIHRQAQNKPPEAVTEYKGNIDKAISNGPVDAVNKDLDRLFGPVIQKMAEGASDFAEAAANLKDQKALAEIETGISGKPRQATLDKIDAAQKKMDSLYGEARDRFRSDLGNEDQRGNVRRLADGTKNKPLAEALRNADPKTGTEANKKKVEAEKKAEKEWLEEEYQEADRQYKAKEAAQKKKQDEVNAAAKFNENSDRELVDQARKTKSYLGKSADDMTPAERAAKREEDEAKALQKRVKDDFNDKVAGIRKDKSWRGIKDDDLTPEQKHAKQLDKEDDDRRVSHKEMFETYGGSMRDLQKKAAEAMRGPSRVIDSAGLANSIQSSVGAQDPQLKMLEELKKVNENLAKQLLKEAREGAWLAR